MYTAPLPSNHNLSEHLLRTAAEHSLRAFLEPNAVFLAQLLHTTYPSHASANLLATAHLRQGNFSQAAQVLTPPTTPENRYLYAVCLTRIGTADALRDAETYLRGAHASIDVDIHSIPLNSIPGSAAGLYLLGSICQRTGRKDEAIALYRRAINANPTLWLAFEALANMGIVTKAEVVLPAQSDAEAFERLQQQPQFFPHTVESSTPRPSKPPRDMSALRPHSNSMRHLSVRTPRESDFVTPSPIMSRLQTRAPNEICSPPAPHHVGRHGIRRVSRLAGSPNSAVNGLRLGRRSRNAALDDSVRNPVDLFATTPDRGSRSITMPMGSSIIKGKSDVSPFATETSFGADNDKNEIAGAMDLIRSIGQIVSELGRFRCARAIELSNCLPAKHRSSGFVLSLRGKAFLERGDYVAAEQEFKKALVIDPMRTDGVVEYYSTVLWHLKKEKALAQLAINVQRIYPVSSSAWCAAGNCYSIQQDPDAALRFFQRAIATSKTPNAYAYTLCGHEYVVKEDFDSALASYREALNIDERHYNAMYGIGQVLQKQEKFGLAQNHFRNAVLVNPLNSTLHYHLGVSMAAGANVAAEKASYKTTQHALISALAELETAANLDPRNPVPRFERAKILIAMNRLPDARKQLEDLRESLPKEAEVHYQLSLVCQHLGDSDEALQALHTALDIEPKERKYKKALDSLSNAFEASTCL